MERSLQPLLFLLVVGAYGCNDRSSTSTGGNGGEGGTTESMESTMVSGTSGVPTACGEDGVAEGVFLIRENADAIELRGCHTIEGDVIIDPCRICAEPERVDCTDCVDASMLTSLEGLESLREVTGRLAVGWDADFSDDDDEWSGPTGLTSLAPLSGIERVGGDFWLDAAPRVREAAFPNLTVVSGELRVSTQFPVDVEFPGLESGGAVSLTGAARVSFDAPRLASLSHGIWLQATRIPRLDGISVLKDSRWLTLHDNELLDTVQWSRLPRVRNFSLRGSPSIAAVDFSGLRPASAHLEGNTSLTSVDGRGLEVMSGLQLIDLPLTEANFEDLRSVEYDFFIWGTALDSLEGFANLERVEGRLWIIHNPNLCQSEVDAFVERVHVSDEPTMAEGNSDC